MRIRVPRAVWLYIEHELYDYDAKKQAIKEMEEDIIFSVPEKGTTPGRGYMSDPTARKAHSLMTSTAIRHMVRVIQAIDRALARLKDEHRKVFELKYRRGLPWQQVCQEMHIDRATFFRYRRQLITMVALEMGMVKEVKK